MSKFGYIFTLIFMFLSVESSGFALEKGLLYQTEVPTTLEGYKEYYLSHSLPGNSTTYIKNSRNDYSYYTLNSDAILFDTDLVPKTAKSFFVDETIVNKWPLVLWQYQVVLSGERAAAAIYVEDYATKSGQMDWVVEKPESLQIGPQVVMGSYWNFVDTDKKNGCLSTTPLRYGDIGSGDENLVLTLQNGRFILFSPDLGKSVFEFNYVNADELGESAQPRLSSAAIAENELGMLEYGYKKLGDEAPQWVAASGGNQSVMRILPAWRSFAKLYEGDINGDGTHNLLVWRKLYQSLQNSDDRSGFQLAAQNFISYKYTSLGYQIEDISTATIESWLTAQNQTWQSGYPSQSECAGEEGQLIPEMHDPLLNDPDVLR
jgi:hypothetical protein